MFASGAREFAQDFRGPVAKHRMAASTVGCLLSIVEHLRMEGKEVGAMPANRTTKKSAPNMSRRARVAEGVGISSAECPAIEASSVCPGLESCSASQPGGKGRNRCVSDENEERSETIGAAGMRRNAEG